MPEALKRPTDAVDLRAEREGDTLVMRMSRATAEAECIELMEQGWSVEIIELPES